MKTIVAVSGVANAGKSSALQALLDALKKVGWNEQDLTPRKNDLNKVYLLNLNGKCIGLNFCGDSAELVRFGLEILAKAEVIICATRPGYVNDIIDAVLTGSLRGNPLPTVIREYNVIEASIYAVRCNRSIGVLGLPVTRMSEKERQKQKLPQVTQGLTTNGTDLNDLWAENMLNLIIHLL